MSELQNIREKGMKSDESINKTTERIIRLRTNCLKNDHHSQTSSSRSHLSHGQNRLVASVSRFTQNADINAISTFLFHP